MKTPLPLILVSLVCLLSSASADTILLSDNFSGSSLDTSKWTTVLPYGTSSVVQSGGSVVTTGRGILTTVEDFTGPYIVNGAFTMLNDFEHFNVVLRSDMSSTGSFAERTGLIVSFSNDGNAVSIQEFTNPLGNWLQSTTGEGGYNLVTGQTYFFSIYDNGTAVNVSVNGVSLLEAATNYSTGNHIGFYSREFPSTATAIDAVTITAVPESGATILYLAFGLAGLMISVKRKVLFG